MLAAWRAASLGAPVRLLERNPRLGVKILISGGGKCNITHAGPIDEVRRAFDQPEARFLAPCLHRFRNSDVLELLERHGVTTHVRPDGRIFPDSARAGDVVEALRAEMLAVGVRLSLGTPVRALSRLPHGDLRVCLDGGELQSLAVVLAVGGKSYPKTGATGDGYPWVEALGHTLIRPRAALAPAYLKHARPDWSGVALRDILLRARAGKEVARWRGDLLFTHRGVSGPTVLGVTREAALAMERGPVTLEVDLTPDRTQEELSRELAEAHATRGVRLVRVFLQRRLPERLIPTLMEEAGLDPDLPLDRLPRPGRNRLSERIKRWSLGEISHIPLELGEVTAGGIPLDEVDPRTMESRKCPGLFPCGEILDIAGPVGGYNLQAAFSTGFVAGESASRRLQGAA